MRSSWCNGNAAADLLTARPARWQAPYLYVREGQAYDKVAGPVAEAGEGHGGRPRPLAEQLGHDEPRDGTRTNLKETDKEEDGRHADVAHPREVGLQEWTRQVGGDSSSSLWTKRIFFFEITLY